MKKLYRVVNNSAYDEVNSCYASVYWTLSNFIKLRSLHKFSKDDVVEIKSISDNIVDIFPVFNPKEDPDKCLVMVSPTVPLSMDADYKFTSKECDILVVLPVDFNSNKSYILLVGVPIGCKSVLVGTDVNTKDKFEFIIESSITDKR